MTSLTMTHSVPDGFLDAGARDLHWIIEGPTLIELPGKQGAPLFVSGLMHGNEDSGLVAIQELLRRRASDDLARPMMILIGNVAAARDGMRRLEDQPDYNRVWPGCTEDCDSDEAKIMAQVHERVVERQAFAAIDIHNNTGRNPHYGVICVEDEGVMTLASLFAPRAVLFRGLPGTQTTSFSGHIPAITVECGQSGSMANAQAAADFVETVLSLETLGTANGHQDLRLFHTLAQVRVRADVALSRNAATSWLMLEDDLDSRNFTDVPEGFGFGETNCAMPFEAVDENGDDVADAFFQVSEGHVRLKRSAVPAMLTTQERIIRQDCLCYLMEELRSGR